MYQSHSEKRYINKQGLIRILAKTLDVLTFISLTLTILLAVMWYFEIPFTDKYEQLIAGTGGISVILPIISSEIRKRFVGESEATPKLNFLSISPDNPSRVELIGRDKEIKDIRECLEKSKIPVVVVHGMGGIGKTALVSEIFEEYKNEYDEAKSQVAPTLSVPFEIFIWLRAGSQILDRSDILKAVELTLEDYKTEDEEIKNNKKKPNALTTLREKKCLLVIDNFDNNAKKETIEFLNKLPGSSKALITSRNAIIASQKEDPSEGRWGEILKANYVKLEEIIKDEAPDFMKKMGERFGISIDKDRNEKEIDALYEITKGNPYAIELSLGLAAIQSLEMVIKSLQEEESNLFDHIISQSWPF